MDSKKRLFNLEGSNEKEDFVKNLIVQAIETEFTDIYKKYSYCVILSKISAEALKLRDTLIGDAEYFRKLLYFRTMLNNESAIDFLGKDLDAEDIYQFDKSTVEKLFRINEDLDQFLGVVGHKLTFGELNIDFSKG